MLNISRKGLLWACLAMHTQCDTIYLYKTLGKKRLSAGKKSTSSHMFFWRYCKDMQNAYFGYFGHARLHTPKMIESTCRKLHCLSPCQKNFIIHYFLEILHFKESCNLISRQHFAQTQELRISPDLGLVVTYQ